MSPDLIGLAEANLAWHLLPPQQRLQERTWGWFESISSCISYASDFPAPSPLLAGGTVTLAINDFVHRVSNKEFDSSKLGRWSSIQIKGKGTHRLRLVTAYRCVRNLQGPLSVWNQQRFLLDKIGRTEDPIAAFHQDLFQAIHQWISSGELIVLGIDLNGDIRQDDFVSTLRDHLGLQEVMTHNYGTNLPNTYARGSLPIDGLFVSSSLAKSNCGYSPIICDHRMLWIDIPKTLALNFVPSDLARMKPTRLKLQDPRVVQKYNSLVLEYVNQHELIQQIDQLEKSITGTITPHQIRTYNKLDSIRTEAILYANRKCRKLRMGAVPFSPALAMAGKAVRAWKLVIRKRSGGRVQSKYLRRMINAAGILTDDVSLSEAKLCLANAKKLYATLKKRADTDRVSWIDSLAQARADEGKTEVANEIRMIKLREAQRRDARVIRTMLGTNTRSGLTSLEIMMNNQWVEITEKTDIEAALCQELSGRFNQASNTPFLVPPLFQEIGSLAQEHAADLILQGNFTPPEGCDPWAAKLCSHLQAVAPEISETSWDDIEHKVGWKRVKERTSAGISGITIPHMKAHTLSPELCSLDRKMGVLPFRFGFSPTRWRKGIDVMLEKKKGLRQINKLRAILLYEADFNQNNKRLGRMMLQHAEKHGAVAPEQYGSRNRLLAADQSLNKALTFDVWRNLKTPGALCSNDAKSCYDRIVHSIASLSMRRVGVPREPISSMFYTIQQLQHHIRTAYGDSRSFFSGADWEVPIQGVGQGNGAGPQIWALISSPLFNMLRSERLGAHFLSAMSQSPLFLAGYGFVDDTDLVVSDIEPSSASDISEAMQESLTAWEGGLHATGGALEPSKSFWYLVDFEWKNGVASYKSVKDLQPPALMARDHTGQSLPLQCFEPWHAERTLGVRLAPDGNMQQQFQYMVEVAQTWTTCLKASHLPRHLAWQAWKTTILKTLEYPLVTTTLSRKQCHKLSSILLTAVLPQTGLVRTFPRAIAHAPKEFYGLDIPDFFVTQGIRHVTQLIRLSCSTKHLTGCLIRHAAESMKLILGCNGPLLQLDWALLHHLIPPSWLGSTWEFVHSFDIKIHDDIQDFIPWRENDALLIPLFLHHGFRGEELRLLNMCRLFLRVSWLSELCTGDGLRLCHGVFDKHYKSSIKTTLQYPKQGLPPVYAWAIWKRALQKLCLRQWNLTSPLGIWIRDPNQWAYDPVTERLYQRSDGAGTSKWTTYAKMRGNRSRNSLAMFGHPFESDIPVSPVYPATVYFRGRYPVLSGFDRISSPTVYSPNSFIEFMKQANHSAAWAVQQCEIVGDWDSWPQETPLYLQAVSDGSFKDGHGTAAFGIYGCNGNHIEGCVITPGVPADQQAYRSELAGIYAIILIQWGLSSFYKVPKGSIEIACDGLSALRQAQIGEDMINPNTPHFDLIMAIRQVQKKFTWDISWRHVRGHQDESGKDLDAWEQANVKMDKKAKQYWVETFSQTWDLPLWGEPWRVLIQNRKLTSTVSDQLKAHCTGQDALEYWDGKKRCKGLAREIDWNAIGGAIRRLPWNKHIWIVKHATGFNATGKNMLRRRERESSRCPRCTSEEDLDHVLMCQGSDADSIWEKAVATLHEWLLRNQVHPVMSEYIIKKFSSWRNSSPIDVKPAKWFEKAAIKQDQIGWNNFGIGFLSVHWQTAQQHYWSRIGCKRSVRRWTSALIRKIWDVAWDMWEHRNGILHNTKQSILITQLQKQIQHELYLGIQGLPSHTHHLFTVHENTLFAKPIQVQRQWLARVRTARESGVQDNARGSTYRQERNIMRQWLQNNQK